MHTSSPQTAYIPPSANFHQSSFTLKSLLHTGLYNHLYSSLLYFSHTTHFLIIIPPPPPLLLLLLRSGQVMWWERPQLLLCHPAIINTQLEHNDYTQRAGYMHTRTSSAHAHKRQSHTEAEPVCAKSTGLSRHTPAKKETNLQNRSYYIILYISNTYTCVWLINIHLI